MPVSSSSQKEEARFLPRAVDGATEVGQLRRHHGPSGPGNRHSAALVPVATLEQRACQPAINDPSFDEDPERLGLWSRPCSEALREDLLVTAKHLPGYRDTFVDSHRAVASVDGDLAHPCGRSSFPFEMAIESGVDASGWNSTRTGCGLYWDPLLRSDPTCFFEWTRVGSPPAARRGPVAKTRNSKCPAQGESVRFRMQLECSMMLTY